MRRLWTSDDIAKLKSMAKNHPPARIAEELGRGISATYVKAHKLKVSLRYRKPAEAPSAADMRAA
jgi:hypothetical protein